MSDLPGTPTDESSARSWVGSLPGIDAAAVDRLGMLEVMLREENQRQNLVSASSLDSMWLRHFADSAQLLCHLPEPFTCPWLDLGTGAGFPGLVVAALCPRLPVVLVESRSRRIEWLQRAASALDLPNVEVIGTRLEQVETFEASAISARAFAPLDRLLDLSARFSTSDTIWLLPKGRSARDEVAGLAGWDHLFHVEQSLTDPDSGIITGRLNGPLAGKKARSR